MSLSLGELLAGNVLDAQIRLLAAEYKNLIISLLKYTDGL